MMGQPNTDDHSHVSPHMIPVALTIAGSDSGGGAGIQADLKTFSANGVYGMSAVTSVTAQNTLGVRAIHNLPPGVVAVQIDTVLSDIGARAIKTGMLANAEIIAAVAEALRSYPDIPLVIDPVMIAKSGDALLEPKAVSTLIERLIPLATVITPNLDEARALTGIEASDVDGMRTAARRLYEMGPRHVVVKGGHLEGPAVDLLFDGGNFKTFEAERIDTRSTHGTGCTFASAIAAGLAKGVPVSEAVADAKTYLTGALRHAVPMGGGHGPVQHFHALYRNADRLSVLDQLSAAVRRLENAHAGDLVPEVQCNLGMGLPGARSADDVAAFPGRLIRLRRDVRSVAPPEFGASSHVARIILTAMRKDPARRSVLNIRYDDSILGACRGLGLSIASFDRHEEPLESKTREGSSLEWGTARVIEEQGFVPDIVYDLGDEGKEPMIRVIASDPERVVDIALAVLEKSRGK